MRTDGIITPEVMLALAIIKQAELDLIHSKDTRKVQEFFRSGWFCFLCTGIQDGLARER